MTCDKCNGLLISERILEFYAPTDNWKCVNCGWFETEREPRPRQEDRSPSRRSAR